MPDERGRTATRGRPARAAHGRRPGGARHPRGPPQRRPRPPAAGARPRRRHRRHRRPARRGRARRHRRRPQPRRPRRRWPAGPPRPASPSASTRCRATPTPSASSAPAASGRRRPGLLPRRARGRRRPRCRARQHRGRARARAACSRSSSRSGCPPSWPGPWPGSSPRPRRSSSAPTGAGATTTPRRAGSTSPAVRDLLTVHGLTTVESHGVRIFSDLVPSALVDSEADRAALLELEDVASHQPRLPAARRPRQRAARPRDPGLTPPGTTDEPPPVRPPRPGDSSEPPDDTGCTVLHVDMDAFYASRRPARAPRAASARRSSSAAATAAWCSRPPTRPARFGVTSAMPMTRARRLCPQAIVLAARPRALRRGLGRGHGDLPLGHPAGRAALARRGVPRRLRRGAPAGQPRRRSAEHDPRHRRTTSRASPARSGSPPTKFVAKLASGLAKPDGWSSCPATRSCRSCTRCRSGRCGAWGSKTEEALHRLGLRTVGDIAHTPLATLAARPRRRRRPPPARARLGPRPAAGRARASARRASAPTRPSTRHRRPGRDPPRAAARSPSAPRPGCGRPG